MDGVAEGLNPLCNRSLFLIPGGGVAYVFYNVSSCAMRDKDYGAFLGLEGMLVCPLSHL